VTIKTEENGIINIDSTREYFLREVNKIVQQTSDLRNWYETPFNLVDIYPRFGEPTTSIFWK
jgi:hypothetical protein